MSASASEPGASAPLSYVVNNARLRARINDWLASAHWSVDNLNRAIRKTPASFIASTARMERFTYGEDNLSRDEKSAIARFLSNYPTPGPFDEFIDRISAEIVAQARSSEDRLTAMRDATERRQADHRKYWLDRERAPRTKPEDPLHGLTKAEIAALSGVSA